MKGAFSVKSSESLRVACKRRRLRRLVPVALDTNTRIRITRRSTFYRLSWRNLRGNEKPSEETVAHQNQILQAPQTGEEVHQPKSKSYELAVIISRKLNEI